MKTSGLPKSERIVSKKLMDALFNSGQSHSLAAFPLRAVWKALPDAHGGDGCGLSADGPFPVQVLFSVSKRRFKHAVDRNRLKRQLREAYRHNKQLVAGHSLAIAFIWLSDRHMPSAQIEKRVVQLLTRIAAKHPTSSPDKP